MNGKTGGLLLLSALCLLATPVFGYAPPGAKVFVNEIHYDNVGTDTGEGVEIAGPAGTDLSGWTLLLYNGADGAVYGTRALSGIIPNQQNGYGTVAFSYPANGLQNGSPDGLALTAPDGSLVQFLSYEGTFTAVGGPANGQISTDIGVAEASDSPVGDSLQLSGSGATYDAFIWKTSAPQSFGQPNPGQTFAAVVNAPVVVSCGDALSTYQGSGAERAVSATDADGTVVGIAISVSPVPASGGITVSNVTPATGIGGTASAVVTVASDTTPGTYVVAVTAVNTDSPAQTGTASLGVNVTEVLSIGAVQGAVGDTADGLTFASPYAGQYVVVRGVIYQKVLSQTSGGDPSYGFFIQNTLSTADGDPTTSDGIYVYTGRYTSLIGGYVPTVGDEVILRARVSEYYNLTELSSASALAVVRTGVDLDSEVPAFETNPPADLADANRYWERHEGMRARVPGGSIVLAGRDIFSSTMDAEVWVAVHSSTIALRDDPYARRAFRDPHPLDDVPDRLFDNGNGYRIVMGSMGVKAAAGDSSALIAPSRTFDVMSNSPVGGVYYSYDKYQIEVEQQPDLISGVDPALNSPPATFDRKLGYSIVDYNLENLYDYYDDPFDPCDFPGNPGSATVSPPFDYVPASDAAYRERLGQIATQIVTDLHSPDILMVQEVEDQDVASLVNGTLVYGDIDNADGQPDALQELALAVSAAGGPTYKAAFDRNGTDDRGIVCAFLYRTDRVELLPANAADPVLGASPQVVYRGAALPQNTDVRNPKTLNAVLPQDVDVSTGVDGVNVFTRAPQVGLFRVWRSGIGSSVFTDLYLVCNHFSSGPDTRVGQRTEQAAYSAAIAAALLKADAKARVIVAGDLNVYPRPDDPFSPGQPLYPSDQLAALYNAGLSNLWDRLATEVPADAYNYVYDGQAQTLDQMFVTSGLLADLKQFRAAHINSDWPTDYDADGARGTSDHDPQAATYALAPTVNGLEALVRYFSATGAITGNKDRTLVDRLEKARGFQESGKNLAAAVELAAFVLQAKAFSPRFVTKAAANALQDEVVLLLELYFKSLDLTFPGVNALSLTAPGKVGD